jgi:hypothetical protein
MTRLLYLTLLFLGFALLATVEKTPAQFRDPGRPKGLTPISPPLVFEDDFSKGADRWEPTDSKVWKVIDVKDGKAFSLFDNKTEFKPPHRSPLLFALVKDVTVGDFILDVKCKSTIKDYPHRDLCFIFCYQDNAHFYYAHLGKKTDDHCNQIFIVDGADRKKISTKTNEGTPWTDDWHHVKIVRKEYYLGPINVYFDDMEKPIMTASDTTFTWGRVGIGSFDDTGDFCQVKLYGDKVEKPK